MKKMSRKELTPARRGPEEAFDDTAHISLVVCS